MKTEHNERFTKAKETALRYLSYRARTRKEMVDRLADFPSEVIDDVLTMLERYGYIDDNAFAEDYVQARVRNKKYGKLRLRHELREKGVEMGIIDTVLSELDFDEVAAALQMLKRKVCSTRKKSGGTVSPSVKRGLAIGETTEWILSEKERKKYSDYLARAGFGYDVINQAFEEYRQSEV